MIARRPRLIVGVDARSLLCREPRGEGKSLLRLYQEIVGIEPGIRLVFFGDEHGQAFNGGLPAGTIVKLLESRGARFGAWENLRLPLAAALGRCSVLHCTSSGGPMWSATPILLTVHDLIPMLVDDGQSVAERRHFRRRLARGLARARAVIAVSGNTQRDLLAEFPDSCARIEVVPWGAPPRPTACPPGNHAAGFARYCLAYGGTAPRKNTVYTLERFAAIAAHAAGLGLVFVGISSATQRAQLEELAGHLGVAGRIHMPGFVDDDHLQALLGRAEMVLYLSRYEGFGLPLLEAVAHGVPVIASDNSSIPEVLGDVEACCPLDAPAAIEAAMLRVASDPEYRQERIRAQAHATARFDWHETATKTLALLHEAADSRLK